MAGRNDVSQAFNAVEALMGSHALKMLHKEPMEEANRLVLVMDRELRKTFTELAAMIRGGLWETTASAEDEGYEWPPWAYRNDRFNRKQKAGKRLKTQTSKRGYYHQLKVRMGKGYAHYDRRAGQTTQQGLENLDPRRVFSQPNVGVIVKSGPAQLHYIRDARGHWRWGRGGTPAGQGTAGSFAPKPKQIAESQIKIEFQSRVDGKAVMRKMSAQWVNNNISMGLRFFEFGRRGQPARPLLGPYIRWVINEKIPSILLEHGAR
jgi:hypothetical protein